MLDVQNDPDRVLHPLRRRARGEGFERVSWDEALADIGSRLRRVRAEHGAGSIGWYMGNPGAFSFAHAFWVKGLLDALGSSHYYTAGSQDVNNRFAASALLYGSPLLVPVPDLTRTRFLLVVGANPLVSHGSLLSAPRVREQLGEIVARGGRVVVVDPRRSETARVFEHVPVHPDTDAWLLCSLLHVLFADGLADRASLAQAASGASALELAVGELSPEQTAARTGVPARTVRELAHALAAARGAAVYGRTGSCLGRFGTLVSFLLDAVNAVSGNLDRPGGAVFGSFLGIETLAERLGLATYGSRRSRVGRLPEVLGSMPASLLPAEIRTPGAGRLRALVVSAGNPVLSVPDGNALETALGELDLLVSIDLYLNETNRHADYLLPATTFLERADLPAANLGFFTIPFVQATAAAVEPYGEAREEWTVVEDLARELGVIPSSIRPLRWLGRAGIHLSPDRLLDLALRLGPAGDRFGLRRGLSLRELRADPHGRLLAGEIATGVLPARIRHRDGRVHLAPPQILAELARLRAAPAGDDTYPLRLIGLRELRSHNSWLHNSPTLARGARGQLLRVHPRDAAVCGVGDGTSARVVSHAGAVEATVLLTDEMMPGTIALPHGWGHRLGGWRLANDRGGANTNLLASADPGELEPLAGMPLLNGIPVRLEAAVEPG